VSREEKQLIAATVLACLAALAGVGMLRCTPTPQSPRADATTWHVAQVHPGFDAGAP